ncbi:unnamed protein product, partial [Mesorhabditis belari]|uniref:Uncharacterized protein n=1 Tax=Mesorhabditis belari TaxID=2138241 RepID=A0AAF3F0R9_9BILA
MLSRKHIAVLLSSLCLARACTPAAEPKTIGTVKLVVNPSVGWTYYDAVAPPNPPASWNQSPLGGGQTNDPAVAEQAIQDNIEVALFHALQDNNIVVNIKSTTNTFKTLMADTNLPLVCKPVETITEIVSCPDDGTDGAEMSGEITIELETALPEGEFESLLQGVIDDLEKHSRIEIVSSADVIFSYKP